LRSRHGDAVRSITSTGEWADGACRPHRPCGFGARRDRLEPAPAGRSHGRALGPSL